AGRVPVARRDHELEPVEQAVERDRDLVAARHGERAARGEVVLEVDDQERVHQPTLAAPAYTLTRPPRAKPHSVTPRSRASSTARLEGAPTPTSTGQPASDAFWTSSNESRPLTQRIASRSGRSPVRKAQ